MQTNYVDLTYPQAFRIDPNKDGNDNPLMISWQSNYYISGINGTALTKNPWLGQTIGWADPDGNMGTIRFQDKEVLNVD